MEERGVTAYRLGKDTGFSRTTIIQWLNGDYEPNIKNLRVLADYFGVPTSYFIE